MRGLFIGIVLFGNVCYAQLQTLPISTHYIDLILSPDSISSSSYLYSGDYFFPASLKDIAFYKKYHDPSTTFTEFEETLLKKHVLEIEEKDVVLNASPVGAFSFGSDLLDTNGFNLFQNTRGVFIEGAFFNDFSFQTSFYENQIRVSSYESDFIRGRGELYTRPWGYEQQNGVIPGGARTKPFKDGGFDYAFAFGHFLYTPSKYFEVLAGNSPQFLGSGYRSMLYSSTSPNVPFLKLSSHISPKLSYSLSRIRGMNLVRKKTSSSVESYYQPKAIGIHYLHWTPTKKIGVNFFEGTVWQMGDSLATTAPNALYWAPLPFFSWTQPNISYSIVGIDLSYTVNHHFRLYGQVASNRTLDEYAFQGGIRGYFPNIMLQLEINHASQNMYIAEHSSLNYANYNLPIAHIKGNRFTEIVARTSYSYHRFYTDFKNVLYFLKNHESTVLLPIALTGEINTGVLNHSLLEVGYRFNPKLNVSIYGQCLWRKSFTENPSNNLLFNLGIKTGLLDKFDDY